MKTIIDVMEDPKLFGPHFQPAESWSAWKAFLKTLFALPMTEAEIEIFKLCTGRTTPPTVPFKECWIPAGRRGGKSRILALVGVYLACFRDYRQYLSAGEVGTLQIIASDRKQARSIFNYAKGLITETPLLLPLLEDETAECLILKNRVTIEITTASYRTSRGYTCVSSLVDEVAFLPTDEDSANADTEIINSIKHASATIPDAILLCASSPYSRRGALWEAFQKYYGNDDAPVLLWKAPTNLMNPQIPQALIEAALQRDEPAARAEYFAEFRSDIEAFLSRESIDQVTIPDRLELPYQSGRKYIFFVDPSGGVKSSFTLAGAFLEKGKGVLAIVRETKPEFVPETVVKTYCDIIKSYGQREAISDRWGSEWTVQAFKKNGVKLIHSEKPRSDLYLELLPAINSKSVELLDIPRLRDQLVSLERRTGRGADSIGARPTVRDDVANAAAGALVFCQNKNIKKIVGPDGLLGISPHYIGGYGSSVGDGINGANSGFPAEGGAGAEFHY